MPSPAVGISLVLLCDYKTINIETTNNDFMIKNVATVTTTTTHKPNYGDKTLHKDKEVQGWTKCNTIHHEWMNLKTDWACIIQS